MFAEPLSYVSVPKSSKNLASLVKSVQGVSDVSISTPLACNPNVNDVNYRYRNRRYFIRHTKNHMTESFNFYKYTGAHTIHFGYLNTLSPTNVENLVVDGHSV